MFAYILLLFFFFFFKQKTAYEMRISDWSSDVCSSDLLPAHRMAVDDALRRAGGARRIDDVEAVGRLDRDRFGRRAFGRHPVVQRRTDIAAEIGRAHV